MNKRIYLMSVIGVNEDGVDIINYAYFNGSEEEATNICKDKKNNLFGWCYINNMGIISDIHTF